MDETALSPLSPAELDADGVTALPSKEVISLLDLNADLDIALDAAAPIDLAVAANANVAAPIDAAVGANVLSGTSLLDANVDIHADANLAAPIDGAVAANANVAAPVDAAVAANLVSPDAQATALAPQDLVIDQQLQDVNATATATQDASVTQ